MQVWKVYTKLEMIEVLDNNTPWKIEFFARVAINSVMKRKVQTTECNHALTAFDKFVMNVS